MLSYILAIVVGSGSLGLYLAAFLFPEVHRKYDLVWSGIGLFYGLTLWVCAGRITGAVLLGQIASVALLGWLGWQTLSLRQAQTPAELKTELPASSARDIFQITIRQLRGNLTESADRSTLVAQLDQAIARLETAWDSLRQLGSLGAEQRVEPLSKPVPQPTDLSVQKLSAPAPPPTPLSSERDLAKGGSSE